MLCDSHSTKPSSSMVGTTEFGFIAMYSGVFTTPNCMPASTRSYFRPSSSAAHSAFFTLTELTRPQILSTSPPRQASVAHRLAVAPQVAGGEVAAVELPDHLAAAELVVVVDRDHLVAAPAQLLDGAGRHVVLDAHVHSLHHAEARAVAGGLRALAVVGDAHQHLGVALRLHGAAHHAEAHHRLAVAGDEAGDDRLVRPLRRADAVRMAGLDDEGRAAVLQGDAVDHHARAEAHVVGLDHRHHHAARVGGGEIHRAAPRRLACAEVLRALEVDQP